jgi:hypothetical protein
MHLHLDLTSLSQFDKPEEPMGCRSKLFLLAVRLLFAHPLEHVLRRGVLLLQRKTAPLVKHAGFQDAPGIATASSPAVGSQVSEVCNALNFSKRSQYAKSWRDKGSM